MNCICYRLYLVSILLDLILITTCTATTYLLTWRNDRRAGHSPAPHSPPHVPRHAVPPLLCESGS